MKHEIRVEKRVTERQRSSRAFGHQRSNATVRVTRWVAFDADGTFLCTTPTKAGALRRGAMLAKWRKETR